MQKKTHEYTITHRPSQALSLYFVDLGKPFGRKRQTFRVIRSKQAHLNWGRAIKMALPQFKCACLLKQRMKERYCFHAEGGLPLLSEPACYGRQKRWNNLYSPEVARGEARGEIGITNSRGKIPDEGVYPDQAALSKRWRNRGSLARPNMERLTNLSFWTWASTGPLL